MTEIRRQKGEHIADLGEVGGAVLVFGGPYSNLEATQALLAEARTRGIPPERVICTGDVAAYAADPEATVEALREAGVAVVKGNCDDALGQDKEDCGCGYAEGSLCERLSVEWYGFAAAELKPEAKRWMRGLPSRLRFRMGGRRLSVVHGGVSEVNRFVFASTPAAEKAREIVLSGDDGVVAGHSGLPFTQIIGGKLWHNAGVIGLPANDGTPRAWYSILSAAYEGIVVEHHAFGYDHLAAAAKMRRCGLPEDYARSLVTGLWPSCDMLPPGEARRRGQPIAPAPVTWVGRGPARAADFG